MPSDFGDESGEKFCDWLLQIGQDAGRDAMQSAAKRLSVALKKTKGGLGEEGTQERPEWARLKLDELTELEGYDTIKQIIDENLNEVGIDHEFFHDEKTGAEALVFRVEDAGKVARVFDELIDDVDKSLDAADSRLDHSREKQAEHDVDRDAESLEKRVARVRQASEALDSGRKKTREVGREDKFQEVKTK